MNFFLKIFSSNEWDTETNDKNNEIVLWEYKLNDNMKTNIRIIDEQHLYFFVLLQKLEKRLQKGNLTKDEMKYFAYKLKDFLDKHFKCEEFLMNYYLKPVDSIYVEQHESHSWFLNRNLWCLKIVQNTPDNWDFDVLALQMFETISDWFYWHIMHSDKVLCNKMLENWYNEDEIVFPEDFKHFHLKMLDDNK